MFVSSWEGARKDNPHTTPPRIQAHPAECGAVSLGIVLEFHGWDISPLELRDMCSITRDGATVWQIQQGASQLGWNCVISKRGLKSLAQTERPVIIHWDFNHFLVLEAIVGDKVFLNDPALGRRIISTEELSNHYTGICLDLIPPQTAEDSTRKPPTRVRGDLVGFKFPSGIRWVAMAPAAIILFVEFMQAGLGRAFYDFAISYHLTAWGFIIAFAMLGLTLAHLFLVILRSSQIDALVLNLQSRYRERFIRRLMRAPLSFHEGHFAGELAGRAHDVTSYVKYQIQCRNSWLLHGVSGSFCLIVLCLISPLLALVSLGPHVALALLMRTKSNEVREANIALGTANSRYEAMVGQRLASMTAVTTMGMQFRVMTSLLPVIATVNAAKTRLAMLQLSRGAVSKSFESANLGLMSMAGYYLMIEGRLGYGGFIFALAVSMIARADLEALNGLWKQGEHIRPLAERCGEISQQLFRRGAQDSALAFLHSHSSPGVQTSLISARGVGFGYDGKPSLLCAVDLDLEHGEILGLHGPSGCGKSTLMEILSGQRSSTVGKVCWQGAPVSRDRKPFGYVFADCFHVSGTLAGLLTGSTKPDLNRLSECLEMVELRDKLGPFVRYESDEQLEKLPLSRGEVQRLALAQALFHADDCIFFDEAFSHLSTEQSARIIKRIRARGTAMILAGQRSEIFDLCDRTLTLNPFTGSLETMSMELAAA